MITYKVFDKDLKCLDFQYEIGKRYKLDSEPVIYKNGYHSCEKLVDCFNYYSFIPENRVCIVEIHGIILKEENGDKICTDDIEIIKELTWDEVLNLVNVGSGNLGFQNSGYRNSGNQNSGDQNSGDLNSGYRNSGDLNSGYRNSGYINSGDRNSGDLNSGYRNSGDLNSGYRNSGIFCNKRKTDNIIIFNKESNISWNEWEMHPIYRICNNLEITKWVSWNEMNDKDKTSFPNAFITNGHLIVYGYKEAWLNLWNTLLESDKNLFKELPNFDSEIFEFITGIKI